MDGKTLLSYEWYAFTPEFLLIGGGVLLICLDLFMPKKLRRRTFGFISVGVVVFSIISLIYLLPKPAVTILFDTLYLDSLAKTFKMILLLGGLLLLFLAITNKEEEVEVERGSFYYVFLFSLFGGMIAVSSADLITLFVGLELLSITSYILVALNRKAKHSSEAGMKYILIGAFATAITLFGYSYLYGLTGTTNLFEMGDTLFSLAAGSDIYILLFTLVLTFIGLSFKLSTVPFHMWVPDVYQGSKTVVAAFLSIVSKATGFAILFRVMYTVFARVEKTENLLLSFQNFFMLLAILTILIGNIAALRQRNIKRLFAYSTISHAGYLLAGFSVLTKDSIESVWFYLLVYVFMNIGAFLIIGFINEREKSTNIREYCGLYKRSPFVALCLSLFLLSLAGIPGTGGFMAKLKIVMASLSSPEPHYLIAIFVALGTILSYFYYFGLMASMFFRPSEKDEKLIPSYAQTMVILVCVLGTIGFGLFPNFLAGIFGSSLFANVLGSL